jgi:hypothetical protein
VLANTSEGTEAGTMTARAIMAKNFFIKTPGEIFQTLTELLVKNMLSP